MSKNKKQSKAEVYRIRYQMWRDLGYSPQEARKRRTWVYNNDEIEVLTKKGVPLKEAKKQRTRLANTSKVRIRKDGSIIKSGKGYQEAITQVKVDDYRIQMNQVKNDTVHSRWGMYTQDKRYRNKTAKIVKQIQRQEKITNDQAYYLLYMMNVYDLTFEEAKEQIMGTEEFEMYRKKRSTSTKRGKRK